MMKLGKGRLFAVLLAAVSEVLPLDTPLTKYRQHRGQQVGARERTTHESGVKEAMRRPTSYDEMIKIGEEVQQRLLEFRDVYPSDAALARMAAKLR